MPATLLLWPSRPTRGHTVGTNAPHIWMRARTGADYRGALTSAHSHGRSVAS
jgi:hypothetical protein